MRKKIPPVTVCLLLILALFAAVNINFELVPTAKGATIYVPTDYPTIQEAIDAAGWGDTVYVYSGTYTENIIVDKSLHLIGESNENGNTSQLRQ